MRYSGVWTKVLVGAASWTRTGAGARNCRCSKKSGSWCRTKVGSTKTGRGKKARSSTSTSFGRVGSMARISSGIGGGTGR